ncbi:hypothetical protein ACWDA8_29645 [Streptomyces sp. NPDC001130]
MARTVRLRQGPHLLTAGVALLREEPRIRSVLRRRLGRSATDLVLAAVNAAANGIGQSPTALALDAALRAGQQAEAVARAAAFDAAHDTVCAPERLSLAGRAVARPPLHQYAGEEYRDQAVTGTLLGAAGALLFTRDVHESAEALLAGNPKAARYGPAAFAATLCTELACEGVLVRNLDRLRQLELVDTVVLHPEALRSTRRTVLDVHPNVPEWDHDHLWQAAAAALRSGEEHGLALRPVPDQGESDTGLMIASGRGRDIGTVLVGWEIDPLVEAAMDAARRAGLHGVVRDDGSLGDFDALADQLVSLGVPLPDVVKQLQDEGRVVLTVAHVPCAGADTEEELDPESRDVLAGLLRSDTKGLRSGNMAQCNAVLARFANNADKLKLVEGIERKIRFPHSIIQAYLGYRMLDHLKENGAGEFTEQALQPPGPSRELLIALVFPSRRRAAQHMDKGGSVLAEVKKWKDDRVRRAPVGGRTLAHRLLAAANRRPDDPKVLDLYAAALEIESVEDDPRLLGDIVSAVQGRWNRVKGDRRTLEDAKLRLLQQIGAALRTVDKKIDTSPLYWRLFQIGKAELSYSIRLAAAQEFGTGGNSAFAVIRERIGLHTDPLRQCDDEIKKLKAEKRRQCDAWAHKMRKERSAPRPSQAVLAENIETLQREREKFNRQYQQQRLELF